VKQYCHSPIPQRQARIRMTLPLPFMLHFKQRVKWVLYLLTLYWHHQLTRLHTICDKLINDYGALLEGYWQDKIQELGGKLVPMSLLTLKSHMDWPGNERGPMWWDASNQLHKPWHSPRMLSEYIMQLFWDSPSICCY